MPIVSIIIPTYNCSNYLEECLEKALGIESKEIEILVINDGSTDSTKEYLDGLKPDPRLKIIHQSNGGVANARNNGLKLATGEYIYFCDSDDEIIPDAFLRILTLLYDKQFDIVVGNFLNQNSDKKTTRLYYPRSITGATSGYSFVINSLKNKEYGSEPVQYFTKRSFYDHFQFRSRMLHEDDHLFTRLLFRAEKVLVTTEAIYFRKYRLNSLSRHEDAGPRNNPQDLKFVIDSLEDERQFFKTKKADIYFKTLKLRSWFMIFDYAKRRPAEVSKELLLSAPKPWKILWDKDILWSFRTRYFRRFHSIK